MQRRRGWIWLGTGLMLALVAGLLTFRALAQATEVASRPQQIEMSPVVVAVQDIPLRTVIQEAQVSVKQIPTELVPAGAAVSLADVVGKIARQDIAAGEVVLTPRLVDPTIKGRDVTFTMPEDKVVIALPASDLMSRIGFLKPGDRVDLLFSFDLSSQGEEKLVTLDAIQNLEVVAMVMPPSLAHPDIKGDQKSPIAIGNEGALLFAVSAQDALMVKFLKDAGAIMDIALRAPSSEQLLETTAVDAPYMVDRYRLSLPSPATETGP